VCGFNTSETTQPIADLLSALRHIDLDFCLPYSLHGDCRRIIMRGSHVIGFLAEPPFECFAELPGFAVADIADKKCSGVNTVRVVPGTSCFCRFSYNKPPGYLNRIVSEFSNSRQEFSWLAGQQRACPVTALCCDLYWLSSKLI